MYADGNFLRHRLLLGIAVFASGTLAVAGDGRADPADPGYWVYDRSPTASFERGQLYGSFDVRGGIQQMPRFSSGFALSPGGFGSVTQRGLSDDKNAAFAQPGGTIGFAFGDGTFPAWMGNRVRVAFSGSYVSGWSQTNQSFAIPAVGSLQIAMVGGTASPGAGYGGFPIFTDSLRIEREGFNLALRLASDLPMTPSLSLSPSISVFGGQTTDTYKYIANIVGTAGIGAPYNLDESIRTREIGGDLGLTATWQFAPGWALNLGGTAAVVWSRSRLSASDCVNIAVTPSDACGRSNPSLVTSSGSESRSTVGFRGTGAVSISADMRFAVLTVGGFARYDSRIAGVSNPQLLATSLATQLTGPARIFYDSGFAFGGMLNLRVPLY
jgi:hypothetical protein